MARGKKMSCHDCGKIFNRKPQNGSNQVCWNCGSKRVTLVTDKSPPPEGHKQGPGDGARPPIPGGGAAKVTVPDIKIGIGKGGGLGGHGVAQGITAAMLQQAKGKLKKVVFPPVELPGVKNSLIPRGVRLLAYAVKNDVVTAPGIEMELIWRERGSTVDRHAFMTVPTSDVSWALGNISRGIMDSSHANYNSTYRNRSADLPIRQGPRVVNLLKGIDYFEYGWKRFVNPHTNWYDWRNRRKVFYSKDDCAAINSYLRNVKQGKIFSERLVIAETGEIFYTPDHYYSFFRYHPGTRAWYRYSSAGGSAGPKWDESFYDEKYG